VEGLTRRWKLMPTHRASQTPRRMAAEADCEHEDLRPLVPVELVIGRDGAYLVIEVYCRDCGGRGKAHDHDVTVNYEAESRS